MANAKPMVQVACICENVLMGGDNIVSLIRIVDKFEAQIPPNLPPGIPAGFPLNIFIRLTFAEIPGEGEATMSVQARKPDGTFGGKAITPIHLAADSRNVQVRTGFHVLSPQDGSYWFDVYWNDDMLTSILAEVKLVAAPPLGAETPTPATQTPIVTG
jgi:hypothetical protein